jgi:hypothetical protein
VDVGNLVVVCLTGVEEAGHVPHRLRLLGTKHV